MISARPLRFDPTAGSLVSRATLALAVALLPCPEMSAQERDGSAEDTTAARACRVKTGLRAGGELVCPRSRVEVYSRYPIHRVTEQNRVIVPFAGNRACPMSGDPVLPDAFFEHGGQRVYFCCKECATTGGRKPEMWHERAYSGDGSRKRRLLVRSPDRDPAAGEVDPAASPEEGELPFQGYVLTFENAAARRQFEAHPHLTVALALFPEARPARNRSCPVSKKPVAPGILAVYDGKVVAFAKWESLARFVDEPRRWMGPIKR